MHHPWPKRNIYFFAQIHPKKPILDLTNDFLTICSNLVNLLYFLADSYFGKVKDAVGNVLMYIFQRCPLYCPNLPIY